MPQKTEMVRQERTRLSSFYRSLGNSALAYCNVKGLPITMVSQTIPARKPLAMTAMCMASQYQLTPYRDTALKKK